MKALMFLSKEKHVILEVEDHPPEAVCIGEDGVIPMRHVRLPEQRLCCYVPSDKSDKWARKRAEKFLADLEKGEMESLKPTVKNDIDLEDTDAVMAAIAELITQGLTSVDAIRAANIDLETPNRVEIETDSTKLDEMTVAKIEQTLDEVSKKIDARIDDKLWVDFTVPQGTTPEGMKFHIRYLKAFAAEIAKEAYWIAHEAITKDRALMIDALVKDSHGAAVRAGWYNDRNTGEAIERNFGEMIALAHSEYSEALEADRKDLMDDKLPQYHGTYVELIDGIIRTLDTLGMLRDRDRKRGREAPRVGQIYVDKRTFNDNRADHKPENRAKADGKAY